MPLPISPQSRILEVMQSSRPHNRRLLFETIRREAPLSRTDLAHITGLTNQTVTNLVSLLLAEGLVQESGRRAPTRGQPARDLVVRPEGALVAGFHLDRRSWSWVVTDLAGSPRAQTSSTFVPEATPTELVPLWKASWTRIRSQFPAEARFWGVGAAGPGPQDAQGVLRSPPDFLGWDGVDLKALVEGITGLEARVENDARAAAVGELWCGWGRTHLDFLYLYCSWVFGLGLVVDGVLRTGAQGRAGEAFDHLPWRDGEEPRAEVIGRELDTLVRALDPGAVVVGGTWPMDERQELALALTARWPRVRVVASGLDDAAAVGAASLALIRRFEEG